MQRLGINGVWYPALGLPWPLGKRADQHSADQHSKGESQHGWTAVRVYGLALRKRADRQSCQSLFSVESTIAGSLVVVINLM